MGVGKAGVDQTGVGQMVPNPMSSSRTSQHDLKFPTYHTDLALVTVSAYTADYTCHAH